MTPRKTRWFSSLANWMDANAPTLISSFGLFAASLFPGTLIPRLTIAGIALAAFAHVWRDDRAARRAGIPRPSFQRAFIGRALPFFPLSSAPPAGTRKARECKDQKHA